MKRLLAHIDDALGSRYDAQELETIKRALCTELLGVSALVFYTKEVVSLSPQQESFHNQAISRATLIILVKLVRRSSVDAYLR